MPETDKLPAKRGFKRKDRVWRWAGSTFPAIFFSKKVFWQLFQTGGSEVAAIFPVQFARILLES